MDLDYFSPKFINLDLINWFLRELTSFYIKNKSNNRELLVDLKFLELQLLSLKSQPPITNRRERVLPLSKNWRFACKSNLLDF
jgi:hypothetical protein